MGHDLSVQRCRPRCRRRHQAARLIITCAALLMPSALVACIPVHSQRTRLERHAIILQPADVGPALGTVDGDALADDDWQ